MKNVLLAESIASQWDIADRRHSFFKHFDALGHKQGVQTDPALFVLPDASSATKTIDPVGFKDTTTETAGVRPDTTEDTTTERTATTLIVPGLLGDSVSAIVAPFLMARRALDVQGYCTQIAWVNGRCGCDYNASLLRESILTETSRIGEPVKLIAYSKGCADVLHMLAKYPDTHEHIAALVSYAGVVRGSPLADNASWLARKILQYAPLPGAGRGDGRAIRDLSTDVRRQWLQDNPLPSSIRYASVAAAPAREQVSRVLRSSHDKLVSKGPHNDSQVLLQDALLPASELLAVVNADHWALALPIEHRLPLISRTLINKNHFPRQLMLRTIIDFLDNEPALRTA